MKENFHLEHPDMPHITLPTLKQKKGNNLNELLRSQGKRSAIRANIRKRPMRMVEVADHHYLSELRRYLADLGGHNSDFIFKPETARTLQRWLVRDCAKLELDIDATPKSIPSWLWRLCDLTGGSYCRATGFNGTCVDHEHRNLYQSVSWPLRTHDPADAVFLRF